MGALSFFDKHLSAFQFPAHTLLWGILEMALFCIGKDKKINMKNQTMIKPKFYS